MCEEYVLYSLVLWFFVGAVQKVLGLLWNVVECVYFNYDTNKVSKVEWTQERPGEMVSVRV